VHRGRLARAARAEHAEHRARRGLEVHAVQRTYGPERLDQATSADRRLFAQSHAGKVLGRLGQLLSAKYKMIHGG
jgi:hypothetical protein